MHLLLNWMQCCSHCASRNFYDPLWNAIDNKLDSEYIRLRSPDMDADRPSFFLSRRWSISCASSKKTYFTDTTKIAQIRLWKNEEIACSNEIALMQLFSRLSSCCHSHTTTNDTAVRAVKCKSTYIEAALHNFQIANRALFAQLKNLFIRFSFRSKLGRRDLLADANSRGRNDSKCKAHGESGAVREEGCR